MDEEPGPRGAEGNTDAEGPLAAGRGALVAVPGPLARRLRGEAGPAGEREYVRLAATADPEELARALVEPGRPLWARELAAHRLGRAGDRRAFEPLVLLLNHRDPACCAAAVRALAELRDPRTPRAAAALATNPLRTAYALYPVRLLTALRAPESTPALIATLERLLVPGEPHRPVASACVDGLGRLGDARARPVLESALRYAGLRAAADDALSRLGAAGAA
ncbi:HEAT repeat domain-containing protein [Streptomyces sp. NBC_00101]|uniref:HEAT repeat domain-containing protein n=1 Tax=Streptomyces sp. NBC_00101 TaxID=2975651 RepID=UPI0032523F7D